VIALGYPFLALARNLYWNWRRSHLVGLLIAGNPIAHDEYLKIRHWRPKLWREYQEAVQQVADSLHLPVEQGATSNTPAP